MRYELNHSRKHNCLEVSEGRHSVGSSIYPCQTRYGVDTGLRTRSRGYKHTNNVCSKQGEHLLRWPAKSLNLNPIGHLLDLLKRKVRAQ